MMNYRVTVLIALLVCMLETSTANPNACPQLTKEDTGVLRKYRVSGDTFGDMFFSGNCVNPANITLPFPNGMLDRFQSCKNAEDTYADVLVRLGDIQDRALCTETLVNSAKATKEERDRAETYCFSPVIAMIADMCTPYDNCPTQAQGTDLKPLYDCVVDFSDEELENDEDGACIREGVDNICSPDSSKTVRDFDGCPLRVRYLLQSILGEDNCEAIYRSKEANCDKGLGEVIIGYCTETSFVEENLAYIIGGSVGFVVCVGGALLCFCFKCTCCERREGSLMGKSVGPKRLSFGQKSNYSNAVPNLSAGMPYSGQPMGYPNSVSAYSSGMPGPSPGKSPYANPGFGSASQFGNMPSASNASMRPSNKYKGVMFNPKLGVWVAEIRANGVNEYLGQFDTEEEAARAYDIRALQVNGDIAELNFPFGVPSSSASKGLVSGGGSFAGMPPPIPSRSGNNESSLQSDPASLKQQLIQFYNFHDPDRPNISGHVDKLFEKYNFTNIARAVKAKYQRLPPGWDRELERREGNPGSSASRLGPPPGL